MSSAKEESSMKMSTRPIIKESLLLLSTCGLNPTNQTWKSILYAVVLMIFILHFLTELVLQFTLNWRGWKSVDALTNFFSFYQVIAKMLIVTINGKKFRMLLNETEKFWPWAADYDSVHRRILETILRAAKLLVLFYCASGLAAVIAYFTTPFIVASPILPFDTYHPTDCENSVYYYPLMYMVQAIDVAIAYLTMMGFDALYAGLITNIVCELKNIKYKFSNLNITQKNEKEEFDFKQVMVLVDHHNLVLKCIKDLDHVYSLQLLNQFLSSLVCICAGLLGIIVNGFGFRNLAVNFAYVTVVLGQIFVYCVSGAFLATESESVCDAVYDSDWWAITQPKLSRTYVIIIQRAQRKENLTAGGMLILNLETFTRIIRMSLSFFMLAQALFSMSDDK